MKSVVQLLHFFSWTVYFLVGSGAMAQTQNSQQLYVDAMMRMKSYGIHTLGGRSVDELIQTSQSIQIKIVPELKFQSISNQQEGVHRGSGYWEKASNTIYLSQKHYDRLGPEQSWLIVHEFSEIMGVNDENFHKSAFMEAIDFFERLKGQNPGLVRNQNSLNILKNQLMQLQGGATGVGGGGDGRTLKYMVLIYFEIFYRLDRGFISTSQLNHLMQLLSQLDIEFSNSISQGDFLYNPSKKLLRVPTDPGVGENFDTNLNAITDLLDLWLKGG